ncbi:glycoprotein-N-acetylgalactosamine 3-beta-galactosyltransferase 1 isoform X2 [Drosophila miranda]|uniref:glycoprotein-N-acetylgalactosamine 3-beta-galactosyltransferase 1 isoform X2 n=1 Tax=Drosophila miranda TaxID=7229 RepID=UPI0007E87B1F|nr:glycoprotein-N-acetylgalactosamine 3-beta-galactosyltransferase 1 isoform X2 [Drosophila miranda]
MSIFRHHRKRMELLLMLLIGLAWGILLSELLQRARWQFNEEDQPYQSSNYPPSSYMWSTSDPSYQLTTMPNNLTTDRGDLAERLFKETRVLCMVLTSPKSHRTRAIHIKRTWGSRCNELIFVSTKSDKELGTVALKVKEGYSNLWGKTRAGLQYVYTHFQNYDWFLKADDDTYVVMENLRSFLYAFTPKAPVYFGSKFRVHVKQGYMSGGAGYVLSKEALLRFMEHGFSNSSICSNRSIGFEDVELGRCMQAVGVAAGDSRDEHGLARFMPFSPLHWFSNSPKWYRPYRFYTSSNSTNDCCSNSAISFHYSNAKDFYVLDYVIYKLRAFGLSRPQEQLPMKQPFQEVMESLQKWRTSKPEKLTPAIRDHKNKQKLKPNVKTKAIPTSKAKHDPKSKSKTIHKPKPKTTTNITPKTTPKTAPKISHKTTHKTTHKTAHKTTHKTAYKTSNKTLHKPNPKTKTKITPKPKVETEG